MFYSKNIVKNLLIFIYIHFFIANFAFADTVPVFWLFDWIPHGTSYIYEKDYRTDNNLKYYTLSGGGSIVYEKDYRTDNNLKYYRF